MIINVAANRTHTERTPFSPQRYRRLVSATLPHKIYNEEEYEQVAETSLALARKEADGQATPEEITLLELLYILLEEYDRRVEPLPSALPHQVLQHYLEVRGMKQKDLLGVYESEGAISDVLNGRRAISKDKAKKLAQLFDVKVDLFL